MYEEAIKYCKEHRQEMYLLFRHYVMLGKELMLQTDLWEEYEELCKSKSISFSSDEESLLGELIRKSQEAVIISPWVYLCVRVQRGQWSYLRVHVEEQELEEIVVDEYLSFKERIISGDGGDKLPLRIDFTPFERTFPKLKESRSIGQGVSFLNITLSNKLYQALITEDNGLIDFLRLHEYGGQQLMLKEEINNFEVLRKVLRKASGYLDKRKRDESFSMVSNELEKYGLLPGWGGDVGRIKDTINLLSDILEAPEPKRLEEFLSRIPMIFNIVALSPHGYFAQDNVLGLPDTGGQVIYILNQVRALEQEMYRGFEEQGLAIEPKIVVVTRLIPNSPGTTCNQRQEKILGTKNAYILRIPFREENGDIVQDWVSRFLVWPYLERFAQEVERELLAEFGGPPNLIIGNYSDGNLVASLLSRSLKVTQCNIAHALEKTKYLFSALYWQEIEDYHFECQFTADIIAMNTANFIITSTYQEIAGHDESLGQYESYTSFTMPGLYRVINGINIFDPKFNIVSPGADPEVYFPYYDEDRRIKSLNDEIEEVIYGLGDGKAARGHIEDRSKPIIFTMARLDTIKNVTGLVRWYGQIEELKETANLLVVSGHVDINEAVDREEIEQIELMHGLMDKYALDGKMRWVNAISDKRFNGEMYRYVADTGGVFVQPALFEAFGLTVIEAMSTGLPTFATCFGGPFEIIVNEESGFHINPNHGQESAKLLLEFLQKASKDKDYWKSISVNAIERIEQKYTWELYAKRMLTLSRVYGFWNYATNLERAETMMYLDMFYNLQYRPLAKALSTDQQIS